VALPLLASRRKRTFLNDVTFSIFPLICVECAASCPNPSTREKVRNNVHPDIKGNIWLGKRDKKGETKKKS
jgi:hypothetical protein